MRAEDPKPQLDRPASADHDDIDPRLLEMLACPLTKAPLRWDRARKELVSLSARLAYPVRDGVPIMLPSEARRLDAEEGA